MIIHLFSNKALRQGLSVLLFPSGVLSIKTSLTMFEATKLTAHGKLVLSAVLESKNKTNCITIALQIIVSVARTQRTVAAMLRCCKWKT